MSLQVIIVGGGIGGLCLAQGLHKAGVSVSVYERDEFETTRPQGYRIHINPDGSRALHNCLPDDLFQAFLTTSGTSGGSLQFFTERMGRLLSVDFGELGYATDPVESHQSVSRMTLRQIIMSGLGDVVHFSKSFTRYEHDKDGKVTAYFNDGTHVTGDVLIGADGGNSTVRRQYLPHAERVDMGVVNILGKYPLTPETKADLSPELIQGISSVMGRDGLSMFIAPQEFKHNSHLNFDTDDFLMWVLGVSRERFGLNPALVDAEGVELQRTASTLTKTWHPSLRRLVEDTDPQNITCTTVRSAVPVDAWESTNITLLGDAIHSMTPARGTGANVALRDASLLCSNLIAVQSGEQTLLQAVEAYESQMIQYGFDAVRASKKAQEQAISANAFALMMVRFVFKVIDRMPRLKRKMFMGFGEN